MKNVIVDLTRRSDGKLNGVSLQSIKVQPNTSSLPSYLQEVNLGANIRAAYFTEGIPADKDLFYYNLVWMKIPTGFDYVKYSRDVDGVISIDETIPTNLDIIAPIMLLFDKDSIEDNFHLCDIYEIGEGGQNGCSEYLASQRQTALRNVRTGNISQKPFYLFKYKGILRTMSPDSAGKMVVKEKDSDYFLFPLVLSDKTVVYYATDERDEEILKILYDDAVSYKFDFVEVDFPLTMNDELGVLVTSQVKWLKK